jgi:protease II
MKEKFKRRRPPYAIGDFNGVDDSSTDSSWSPSSLASSSSSKVSTFKRNPRNGVVNEFVRQQRKQGFPSISSSSRFPVASRRYSPSVMLRDSIRMQPVQRSSSSLPKKAVEFCILNLNKKLDDPRARNDEKCKSFASELLWTKSRNGRDIPMYFISRKYDTASSSNDDFTIMHSYGAQGNIM